MKLSKANMLNDWQVSSEYELVKLVGKGSYGQVAEAMHLPTKKKVAIKRIDKIFDDKIECKRILREITLLRKLKHPNLIGLLEILLPKDKASYDCIYLVMEYCQTDLKKLFKTPVFLDMKRITNIIYQILCGLKYLHSAGVLHRDLKPANVLINEDCSVKICDFGLARSFDLKTEEDQADTEFETNMSSSAPAPQEAPKQQPSGKGKLTRSKPLAPKQFTKHVVTRWYRAPQVILLESSYTQAIDVWSAGCIFGELLSMLKEIAPTFMDRSPLFPGTSCFPLSPQRMAQRSKSGFPTTNQDQLNVIMATLGSPSEQDVEFVTDPKARQYIRSYKVHQPVRFSEKFPKADKIVVDFLERSIVFDPRKRISVSEALAHPLFQKVRNLEMEKEANQPCVLQFDDQTLQIPKLRQLFLKEIELYYLK